MKMRFIVLFSAALLLSATSVSADWWDSFIDGVHEKITGGADFIRDTAGPTIREKFDALKAKLQDPATHEEVQTWVKEVSCFSFQSLFVKRYTSKNLIAVT